MYVLTYQLVVSKMNFYCIHQKQMCGRTFHLDMQFQYDIYSEYFIGMIGFFSLDKHYLFESHTSCYVCGENAFKSFTVNCRSVFACFQENCLLVIYCND